MLEGNNIIIDEELMITLCNDIIKEKNKMDKKSITNDICIKAIDYLMF